MRRRGWTVVALVVVSLLATTPAFADGIIIPRPPPDVPRAENLWIKHHRVQVTIEDQVARTRVDQVFVNENRFPVEGTYIFPLPERASISRFTMWVDGQPLDGRLLPRDEARRIYEEIVRSQRDPALLEYVGRDAFQASIFPIPAGGESRIEIEYTEVLELEQGLARYVYPLNTEKFSSRPIEDVAVSVEIRSSRDPIRSVYCSSHDAALDRESDFHVRLGYEESNALPDRDFVVYYGLSGEAFGLNLLSYRQPGEDGFFLLLAAPQMEVADAPRVAKDVLLVLDISGSMQGEKIAQAKEALRFVLRSLYDDDRFNVVAFSTGVRAFEIGLQPASARGEALRWVDDLRAAGGTNIHRALLEAFVQADRERPTIVIFLTDGLATEGETDTEQILREAGQQAPGSVRLFAFGVGYDVNTVLLDKLAESHRGASAYVRPGQNIETEVSAFYAKVSTPLLADLELDFADVQVEESYPYPLPDLFAGSQLVLVGRYRAGGPTVVTLSGEVNGEARRFVYDDLTLRDAGGEEFIPRLWATRKIGYLLSQIRLYGEDRELVQEVVDLSVRYGIITPYTSFLVEEPTLVLRAGGRDQVVEREMRDMAAAAPMVAGESAVQKSVQQEELKAAERAEVSSVSQVRQVADKTFVLQDNAWVDTAFDSDGMTPTRVPFGSEAYFRLLSQQPTLGRYLALGQEVTVVWQGQVYQVTPGDSASPVPPTAARPGTATPPTSAPTQAPPAPSAPALAPPAPSAPAAPPAALSPWEQLLLDVQRWLQGLLGR
ncbi:MAG: VWA domain-containing protein [Chloroflexi bacterium]|nr:VWA domain-containing protein [Chloroflexota bacterium]